MERKLKERMLEESGYPDGLKEELWGRIEAGMDAELRMSRGRSGRNGKRREQTMKRIKITTAIAAALIAGAAFLSMPAGTAVMKEVQTWFEPEKKVEVELEGQKEQTDQKLHESAPSPSADSGEAGGESARYVIYYDQERYKLVTQDGIDVITTKEPLPEKYPEVSMTIVQQAGAKPEELIRTEAEKLSGAYLEVREVEQVSQPVVGYRVRAVNGTEWDSKVAVVYVVDNGKGGSFVLTEKYFLEASEGHGARFEQMLKEFKVVGK